MYAEIIEADTKEGFENKLNKELNGNYKQIREIKFSTCFAGRSIRYSALIIYS